MPNAAADCVSGLDEKCDRGDLVTRHVNCQNDSVMFVMDNLTPELSRPAAGWRTRASVAEARGRRHDAGSA